MDERDRFPAPDSPAPDGRHDRITSWSADSAADLGVRLPNDASELESDRRAWLAETESDDNAFVGFGMPSFFATQRWTRYGLSGPLLALVLVLVAGVGSLMTVMAPRPSSNPDALPLASSGVRGGISAPAGSSAGSSSSGPVLSSGPVSSSGTVGLGGVLPATAITVSGIAGLLDQLRPAVLVLAPPNLVMGCPTCAAALRSIWAQAREYRLRTYLVGGPAADQAALLGLSRDGSGAQAAVVVDRDGALTQYASDGQLTLVLVHADGVVSAVVGQQMAQGRLEPLFSPLRDAGASAVVRQGSSPPAS